MIKLARSLISRGRDWLIRPLNVVQRSQYEVVLRAEWARLMRDTKNPLNCYGAKYFSQTDEDGITLEILRRLNIVTGTFAELGVGDGLENNTLVLLAKGWRGFWIGGQDLQFKHSLNPGRFKFFKAWVSLENVFQLMKSGLDELKISQLDVLSLDLDGNDYYFARELLKKSIRPKVFILEYNAKFPPPIEWSIKYNAKHSWDGSDYYGASLELFAKLLAEFSYTLICCNAATGANAFFIRNEFLPKFTDVPKSIEDIFIGCRYQLCANWGHRPSGTTIERMLEANVDDLQINS